MKKSNILRNAEWIIACKIIQALLQFAVGILTVRYLGPSNYGLVNYAASVVAFLLPVMELGMRNTLVQEYVENPEREGQIMGTGLVLNMLSAGASFVGVLAFVAVANPGDSMTLWVCALYSLTLFAQAFGMLQYWFQAKLLSQYSSVAMLIAYAIMSGYKIFLLATGKSVQWFALSYSLEYGVAGILMLGVYLRKGQQKLRFSFSLAKMLLAKSRHYILAMVLVVVYGRVANILLMQFCGEAETGIYAAAYTCIYITGFVFTAIIDTARPIILEAKRKSDAAYQTILLRVNAIVSWLAILQGVAFTVFADLIVRVLYGDAYSGAVPALRILVWNLFFAYAGDIRNVWILGEAKHHYLWAINLVGTLVSVAANLCLIPVCGAVGASIATVLTHIVANILMSYLIPEMRGSLILLLRSLNPGILFELVKKYLHSKQRNKQ